MALTAPCGKLRFEPLPGRVPRALQSLSNPASGPIISSKLYYNSADVILSKAGASLGSKDCNVFLTFYAVTISSGLAKSALPPAHCESRMLQILLRNVFSVTPVINKQIFVSHLDHFWGSLFTFVNEIRNFLNNLFFFCKLLCHPYLIYSIILLKSEENIHRIVISTVKKFYIIELYENTHEYWFYSSRFFLNNI